MAIYYRREQRHVLNLDFIDRFSQKSPISNPGVAPLIHADRRTNGQTDNLIPFHSKRALILGLNFVGNDKTYFGLHIICPIFLPHSNRTLIFLTHFSKSPLSNFMEICPLGYALIHADGQTDVQTERQVGVQMDEGKEANRRFP